jgi:hypothetical protein
VVDIHDGNSPQGRSFYPSHSFLQLGPWRDEGPLRIEVVENHDEHQRRYRRDGSMMVIRATTPRRSDWNRPIPQQGENGATRQIFRLEGPVEVHNADLMHHETGQGFVHTIWQTAQRAASQTTLNTHEPSFFDSTSFTFLLTKHLYPDRNVLPAALILNSQRWAAWNSRRPGSRMLPMQITALFLEEEDGSADAAHYPIIRRVFNLPDVGGSLGFFQRSEPVRRCAQPVTFSDEWALFNSQAEKTALGIEPLPLRLQLPMPQSPPTEFLIRYRQGWFDQHIEDFRPSEEMHTEY